MIGEIDESALDLQIACDVSTIPSLDNFQNWARQTLEVVNATGSFFTVRIVDENEISDLNRQYRLQDKATNVLSFPFDPIEGIETLFLGDIAICASIVEREARAQSKPSEAHWAHILIHGILHLCGYDHIVVKEADEMEALEASILSALGYPDPYL